MEPESEIAGPFYPVRAQERLEVVEGGTLGAPLEAFGEGGYPEAEFWDQGVYNAFLLREAES